MAKLILTVFSLSFMFWSTIFPHFCSLARFPPVLEYFQLIFQLKLQISIFILGDSHVLVFKIWSFTSDGLLAVK
jgi:hypothetical protein